MSRLFAVLLTGAALLWWAVLLSLPVWSARFPVAGALVYGGGALVCHQQPARTFHVGDQPLPVCARCTGLYVAGFLGAVGGWIGVAREPRRVRVGLALAALPTAVTLLVEWSGLGNPGNAVRAAAALPLGGYAGWLFVRLLRGESRASTCATIG
jgi:uncharacterized membrane protein